MTDREKLIELIANGCNCPPASCCDCKYHFFADPDDAPRCNVDALLADTLIANGVTFQQWIPVSERLPNAGALCVVADATEGRAPRFSIDGMGVSGNWHFCPNRNVTHWMPLTEPPKRETK